jgi:hypothetical protein
MQTRNSFGRQFRSNLEGIDSSAKERFRSIDVTQAQHSRLVQQ